MLPRVTAFAQHTLGPPHTQNDRHDLTAVAGRKPVQVSRPGLDKEFFCVFDYCRNLEYFSQNPEGSAGFRQRFLATKLIHQPDELVEVSTPDLGQSIHYSTLGDTSGAGLGANRLGFTKGSAFGPTTKDDVIIKSAEILLPLGLDWKTCRVGHLRVRSE